MPVIEYVDTLDEDRLDWIRTRIRTERGKVVHFTVQYETIVEGKRLVVIRYDSAHGFPHVDVLNLRGDVISKKPMADGLPQDMAVSIGVKDIRENWTTFRKRFFGE